MAKTIICYLDDFCDEHNCLDKLIEIRRIYPNFKVTLFTIPAKTSRRLLKRAKSFNWIQLALHGLNHDSNYEFAYKDFKDAMIDICKGFLVKYYVRGFKAPGWQISIETMQVLKRLGFWVAVQYSDNTMKGNPDGPNQPAVIEGLKYYALNELDKHYRAIHGHTWDCCNNGIDDIIKIIKELPSNTKFKFISEII